MAKKNKKQPKTNNVAAKKNEASANASVSVEVSDNVLIVEGKDNQSGWTHDFSKKFRLPDSADIKKVEAKMENGILKLRVPKRKESVSKKIQIL